MKLNTKHSLDRQMINRYSELLDAHPHSHLTMRSPTFPNFDEGVPPFDHVLKGRLTHVLFSKPPLLLVTWTPSEPFKALFAQYGTTNDTQTS